MTSLSAWNLDPLLIGGLLLAAACYARGVAVVWRRGGTGALVSRLRVASFALGLYVLALALVSPLDALAHLLFSAHMVQHVLLMLVAAPLLVLGAPLLPLLWALPRGARLAVIGAWSARPALRAGWHACTGPVVVWSVLATTLWLWHLPAFYQVAVTDRTVHVFEHASMLTASFLFWWVVLQPVGPRRIDGGTAVLLVFATKVQSATLGALITFVPAPLYPVYEGSAAVWGMTLMQDQQLAGLVMGTVSGLVFLAVGAWLFLTWLGTIERRSRPPGAPAATTPIRAPRLDLARVAHVGEEATRRKAT
ncbi:MAG: cytochrome c oxidase assembly protein [Trueperaceae bacterium]|nr:cytochrome c oxidase assembly protein [Trueperaceae bacterium]